MRLNIWHPALLTAGTNDELDSWLSEDRLAGWGII